MTETPARPTLQDVPDEVDERLLYWQMLMIRWELNGQHAVDHAHFQTMWTWACAGGRVLLVSLPVGLTIFAALHIGASL
jgi:hypothetical protein